MALTVAITERSQSGNKLVNRGTVAFDASYSTGGESLTANQVALRILDTISFEVQEGFSFEYDYSNATVIARCPAIVTGAAGALTIDDYAMSGVGSTTTTSVGLEASLSNPTTSRLGAMQEVADSEDLSSVGAVRFVATGV